MSSCQPVMPRTVEFVCKNVCSPRGRDPCHAGSRRPRKRRTQRGSRLGMLTRSSKKVLLLCLFLGCPLRPYGGIFRAPLTAFFALAHLDLGHIKPHTPLHVSEAPSSLLPSVLGPLCHLLTPNLVPMYRTPPTCLSRTSLRA